MRSQTESAPIDVEPDSQYVTDALGKLEALANNTVLASLGSTSLQMTTFEALAKEPPVPDTIIHNAKKPEKTSHWTNLGGERKKRDDDK